MALLNTHSEFGFAGNAGKVGMGALGLLGAVSLPFQAYSLLVPHKELAAQAKLQNQQLKAMKLLQKQQAAFGLTGTGFLKGLEAFNTITMPLGFAGLFIPDATSRLQAKLQKQQADNPWLAKGMGAARDVAAQTLTDVKGVMTANPTANRIQPGQLPPNSLD